MEHFDDGTRGRGRENMHNKGIFKKLKSAMEKKKKKVKWDEGSWREIVNFKYGNQGRSH